LFFSEPVGKDDCRSKLVSGTTGGLHLERKGLAVAAQVSDDARSVELLAAPSTKKVEVVSAAHPSRFIRWDIRWSRPELTFTDELLGGRVVDIVC